MPAALLPRGAGHARLFAASRSRRSSLAHAHAPQAAHTQPPNLPYFVPRNSRAALPVYSDIRNGRSRYRVLVKNVQGNINVSFSLMSFLSRLPTDAIHHLLFPGSPRRYKLWHPPFAVGRFQSECQYSRSQHTRNHRRQMETSCRGVVETPRVLIHCTESKIRDVVC